ncbi:hypothetical protein MTBBW1_1610027 [Desulfamplus magnetovallimortis]|uniref:Uncharacterized protein n=1 Tax=Desulfamplus magnetovallimortis TaxID=1246637 RepID=A0A1W1H8Y7_9BACT|nr:hypothetical protein [Desulfamplus magnetovallimortis]SLM28865.1 hypothetical protein MTBBW1_1610027 [Desulfamplus magnetovallimortis]
MKPDFRTAKLMAVIFTPEFSITDRLAIANAVQTISGGRFNGEFISVPVAQDAAPEIPRIILTSKDGTWKFEVSLLRSNLTFFQPANLAVNVPTVVSFGKFAGSFFSLYQKSINAKAAKLGFVTEKFMPLDREKPSGMIVKKFCNEHFAQKVFDNTEAFELHSLKKYPFDRFHINSWVKFKSAKLANKARTPIILVENDINTYMEGQEGADFKADDIMTFFSAIPDHLESISALFF